MIMITRIKPSIDASADVDMIVTRHRGLVEYLRLEYGIEAPVIERARRDDVAGRIVIGVLPVRLAAHARMLINIPLYPPPDWRHRELTADEVAKYAGDPEGYIASRIVGIGLGAQAQY